MNWPSFLAGFGLALVITGLLRLLASYARAKREQVFIAERGLALMVANAGYTNRQKAMFVKGWLDQVFIGRPDTAGIFDPSEVRAYMSGFSQSRDHECRDTGAPEPANLHGGPWG